MIDYFNRAMRYRKVTGRYYTEAEMARYGIVGFYNMVGDVEVMSEGYVGKFVRGLRRAGSLEVVVVEKVMQDFGNGNPGIVVTAAVFRDRESFYRFALQDDLRERYFHEGEWDEPVRMFLN